jgi:hypothetical protein
MQANSTASNKIITPLKTDDKVAAITLLDDWELSPLHAEVRHGLPDDRNGHCYTLFSSQLPVEYWHDTICDHTLGACPSKHVATTAAGNRSIFTTLLVK